MQEYVIGFLFRENKTEVALIRKNRPNWQKGKLNGIGGKIEPAELPYAAMCREFREEAGADVRDWVKFAELTCSDALIHFFRSEAEVEISSQTDEEVFWVPVGVQQVYYSTIIPNLRWLIPMAADQDAPFALVVSDFSGK